MEFWTASSEQLYSWALVWAVGRLAILVNTSQSILNFRNCCVVISKKSCGSFEVGGFMWLIDDTEWKWIVTWASGREDYMHIGAFHHAQVVSSIPSVLIGCEPRSGYASVHIYWPTHWNLFVSRRQPGRRAGKYYFLLCVRAVVSSSYGTLYKTDIIRYYLLPKFTVLKLCNQIWIVQK